ncbi:hypothetical protein [Rhizobium sp. Root483D2]|uniref:hypothetical protein n=1 Tax=Rhizobium sp. Root483D2 TaxID=1736545 RepID=UPI0007132D25|nr:hypothetical protein [Rhizobium sp. Root483D2]KQY37044.1 hypothetical protein ASD32_17590 [Rhizobium sp. Root483D2]
MTAELDSHKRRRKQAFLKGFKIARDLAAQVATVVDTTDRSLLANAIRAIEPPKRAWLPKDKGNQNDSR